MFDSTLERLHLLTRKNPIINIEASFNLLSSAIKHPNDASSVECWVEEMQQIGNCVLFYKPQNVLMEDQPILKSEDFELIIMTDAQCEFFEKIWF